jgi:Fur family transcriptional regulator, ferric uptake regulator
MADPVTELDEPWRSLPDRLRARGLRWTPQREAVVTVLAGSDGHVTGAQIVERCRAVDPATTPSTVYRTLDALEELGVVRHGHGADGREEYHVEPAIEHGHRYCIGCGQHWDIEPGTTQADAIAAAFAPEGFEVDLSHVTVVGRCASCR